MEQNGTAPRERNALRFCGQEACRIDANGRARLTPAFLRDFRSAESESLVLHCLPEGALAVYPLATWNKMQAANPQPEEHAANSAAYRRRLRRLGAMTRTQRLSSQGRITIPQAFREITGLTPGAEAVLVGCRIGVEIWNRRNWEQEIQALREHEIRKAAAEMDAEVDQYGAPGGAEYSHRTSYPPGPDEAQ